MTGRGALGGLRVLDVSSRLGAYCTKVLADFGADVVKVEPPGGDELRACPPFEDGRRDLEASLVFAYYHRNKRGVTLDRRRAEAAALQARLFSSAAVVVTSPPDVVGEAQRDGFVERGGIVCNISPFGLSGPYKDARATHLTSTALGGAMVSPGDGTPPRPIPDQQLYDETGVHAALAVLVALRNRPSAGGQSIDISAHEVIASRGYSIHRFALSGFDELQTSGAVFPPPAGTYACSDGSIEIQVVEPHQWQAFRRLIGNPKELSRPEYDEHAGRHRDAERIEAIVARLLAGERKADVFARAQELGIPCSPVHGLLEFVRDPHTVARGTFSAGDSGGAHPIQQVARASQPLVVHRRGAPTLGEHNDEVYVGELGYSPRELAQWRRDGIV